MQVARPPEFGHTEASRFNRHADRLRERHGERVWRVGVDGGFSCPHRIAGRGAGGCTYCAPSAGAATYLGAGARENLDSQIERGLSFLRRRYAARAFFLYFQAYSSTNAPPERLRAVYEEGLAHGGGALFRGLVVSTRPDCVDEEKAELLASFAAGGLEVWVELGLQSAHDRTLARIRRGHDFAAFERARRRLELPGLRTAAHLILGLPGESRSDMVASARAAAELGLEGVKFHDLQLARGSALAAEYLAGEISLWDRRSLPAVVADCLEVLPPECEVIRLCADMPAGERLAPRFVADKTKMYEAVEAELVSRGTRQGSARGRG
ncbi:MAG: TIGR01212 family radical SAM protein [Treponema sp.]|nr:TIGR01212 family radical SAM protein [Treponema sp.]